MAGLVVFIVCTILAMFTFKKTSNRSRLKGRGRWQTLLTSLPLSIFVFMVSMGIGAGIVSQDNKTDLTDKASTKVSTKKLDSNVYICNKFDAITQTRQGTKYNSGFYSDGEVKTTITYTISDDKLSTKMIIPGFDDSADTATFNKIAEDGSRKYGNSSSNFFVYKLNDSTIKVIIIDFNHNGTITQICSK